MAESSNRIAIIAGHGTLDAAYPPLILATAATAMDMEAAIFFTFYGLEILKKGNADRLQVAPISSSSREIAFENFPLDRNAPSA